MSFVSQFFWLLCMFVSVVNAALFWSRSHDRRRHDPTLESGYRWYIVRFLVLSNIPWLIMGAGAVAGGVPSVFNYLNPSFPSPWVAAWYTSVVAINLLHTYWVVAMGGAEHLLKHPIGHLPNSVPGMKAFSLALGVGSVVAVGVAYAVDFQVP
jgi:hypothetical protein